MKITRLLFFSFIVVYPGLFSGCDKEKSVDSETADYKVNLHDSEGFHEHDEVRHPDFSSKESADEDEHDDLIRLTPEAVQQAGIRIDTVRKHLLLDAIHAPARVEFNAHNMAYVGSPLSGQISEIKVMVGDKVNQGDILLVVQSPAIAEAQTDYLLKRIAVDTAQTSVDLAKVSYERAKMLHGESQGIALSEVLKRENDYKTALDTQLAAQTQAEIAKKRLLLSGMDTKAIEALEVSREISPFFAIRAPIHGQVIKREVVLGEMVNSDRQALLILADMSTLWILADVPEARLNHLKPGAKAKVTVPALPGKEWNGTVTFIAPMLNSTTRTGLVRIEINHDSEDLRPGMFAQAAIIEANHDLSHEPALAVPEQAIQWVEGEWVVFVAIQGKKNIFEKRPVIVGKAVGGLLPVLSGLKEGESFVSAGGFILKAELGKNSAEHNH